MTNKEAFELVKKHLLSQNKKSLTNTYFCSYRSTDGLKCSIGVLIPDNEYYYGLEGMAVESIVDKVPNLRGLDPILLKTLQYIHDRIEVQYWKTALDYIEKQFAKLLSVS